MLLAPFGERLFICAHSRLENDADPAGAGRFTPQERTNQAYFCKVCTSAQRLWSRGPYTAPMQNHYRKIILAGAWMTIVVAVTLAADVTSLTGRFVLAAFGLVPVLVVMRFWSGPPQTISESISSARRGV